MTRGSVPDFSALGEKNVFYSLEQPPLCLLLFLWNGKNILMNTLLVLAPRQNQGREGVGYVSHLLIFERFILVIDGSLYLVGSVF